MHSARVAAANLGNASGPVLTLNGAPIFGTTAQRSIASVTHEAFVHAVRAVVAHRASPAIRERLLNVKLVYGAGDGGYRGICYYGAWINGSRHEFVEIAASGEESNIQLAGTTIHELGHVVGGCEICHASFKRG